MEVIGKRTALINEYDIDVDDRGRILKLVNNFTSDFGSNMNDGTVYFTMHHARNCYTCDTWDVSCNAVMTDSPCNTVCRAPGTTEAVAMAEVKRSTSTL